MDPTTSKTHDQETRIRITENYKRLISEASILCQKCEKLVIRDSQYDNYWEVWNATFEELQQGVSSRCSFCSINLLTAMGSRHIPATLNDLKQPGAVLSCHLSPSAVNSKITIKAYLDPKRNRHESQGDRLLKFRLHRHGDSEPHSPKEIGLYRLFAFPGIYVY
jgi:hypothetical protein